MGAGGSKFKTKLSPQLGLAKLELGKKIINVMFLALSPMGGLAEKEE